MLSLYLNGHAIINLKVQPEHGAMLRDFYPYIRTGWHMNKQHWISIFSVRIFRCTTRVQVFGIKFL